MALRYAAVAGSRDQTVAAAALSLSVSSRYDKMNELQTTKLSYSMEIHYKPQTVCLPAAETSVICVIKLARRAHVLSERGTK
jgi:RNase adaptor protein for sRNA GlmZ degradation